MTRQVNNSIKIWIVLVFVFALGGVTGAALNALYQARSAANPPESSIRNGDAYFETLKRELELSPEQASLMRTIIDETRSQYKAVCAEVRPRYDVLRESARSRMRVLLSADQQKRFDSIVTREDCQCPDQKSK